MFALVLSCDHGLPAPTHLSVHGELLAAVLDRLLNCLGIFFLGGGIKRESGILMTKELLSCE